MTSSRLSALAMAMVVAVSAAACRRDPPPPPAPSGPTAEELAREDSIARARQDSIARAQAEADRLRAEADRLAAAQRQLRATLEAMVNFEYDEASITPQAESILREKVDILRANPNVQLRIEGHADERGSTEYNQALAARRAEAVRSFLTGFGLEANRFSTVSYGEERPLVNRSDEAAWAQNRRAEFVITAGGAELTPPR